MKYKAIFFDLDGTLLPCDIDVFTKAYFTELAKVLAPYGYEKDELVAAIWGGTKLMYKNDGSKSNCDVFWECFAKSAKGDVAKAKELCDAFYTKEFNNARAVCGENPLAVDAVKAARAAADVVVCATNPLFPMDGQRTRLSWVGLDGDMFDLVTSYETQCFCKPNPAYYKAICDKFDLDPSEVLMIGNDEDEDMFAAASLGMDTYLVTDCIISRGNGPYEGKRGTFAEMVDFLRGLNS